MKKKTENDIRLENLHLRVWTLEKKQNKIKNFFKDLKVLFAFINFEIVLFFLLIFTENNTAANILGYTMIGLLFPIVVVLVIMMGRMK